MAFNEKPTQRIDWETPDWLFGYYNRRFEFTTDVCADEFNHKCEKFYSVADNGLAQKWGGACWMNPPYGRGIIAPWIKKAYDEAVAGNATTVCLIPNRSDQEWWEYVVRGQMTFLTGRVKFVGGKSGSMFCSVVVIFHAHLDPGGKSDTLKIRAMQAEHLNRSAIQLPSPSGENFKQGWFLKTKLCN